MSRVLRCVIVDDEPLARRRLAALLGEVPADVEIVGEAESGQAAVTLIADVAPDVVFLDIQMPVLDGFDVVDLLPEPRPQIIFVTAFDAYALQAFEVHAVDYLTKPVRLKRLVDAISVLQDRRHATAARAAVDALSREHSGQHLTRLTVRVGRRLRVVPTADIRWIEADDKLVFVHLDEGRYPVDFTLDELEERLDPADFMRLHRSHIANVDGIRELVPWFGGSYIAKLDDDTQLHVARRRVRAVRKKLGG